MAIHGFIASNFFIPIASHLLRSVTSRFGPSGTPLSPTLVAPATQGVMFEPGSSGADVVAMAGGTECAPKCPPGYVFSLKQGCCVKSRRRRRRMLTCSDKADIAFLTATLGKGEMAKSAIGSLLAGGCR